MSFLYKQLPKLPAMNQTNLQLHKLVFFSWTENMGGGVDAIKCGLVKYGQHNG